MSNLLDINNPEFAGIYNEILEKGNADGVTINFIVPSNSSGLILPASTKLTNEYFGDGEYDRRLSEIEEEDNEIFLDFLPNFEDLQRGYLG